MSCKYDRETGKHLTREHLADCLDPKCDGCRPCTHDDDGNPVRHCRTRRRCTSHLAWEEFTCPACLAKIRDNLDRTLEALTLMPREAELRGIDTEPANLAGPHADYVRAQWRLINAERNGESVDELDMRDPYTCLTFLERECREHLGHDDITLVSETISGAASYLDWVLTDLARDEEASAWLVPSILSHTATLRLHVETALLDSRTPERGIPCPDCVREMGKRKEALQEAGVPEDEWPKLRAPRLVRHYGHWCTREGCEKIHYLDTSGDVWRCESGHEWTHAEYEARLVERRKTA